MHIYIYTHVYIYMYIIMLNTQIYVCIKYYINIFIINIKYLKRER